MNNDQFITYSETVPKPDSRNVPWIAYMKDEGLNCFYSLHWNMEKEATPNSGKRVVGHPPHKHKETEMIFLIGMDPNDPFELGAEVKLSIGDDMKEYAITRSCAIRIPPETPHGFYSITFCYMGLLLFWVIVCIHV